MKVLAVVLLALTLAFVAAESNTLKIDPKNATITEESEIIGGIRTDVEMSPWIVAILLLNHIICCGNLIASRIVLTVSHCLIYKPISELTIRSGSDYHDKEGLVVAVVRVTLHPQYIYHTGFYNFDIAIMFLANSAIVPGIPARSITLWDTDTLFPPGTLATVSGWGWTEKSGRSGPSSFLRSLVVPVVPADACTGFGQSVTMSNLCAGFSTRGKDPCKGDSGTGLVIDNKLAGVHSFGRCGKTKDPSGYTSIPIFRNWIRQQVNI